MYKPTTTIHASRRNHFQCLVQIHIADGSAVISQCIWVCLSTMHWRVALFSPSHLFLCAIIVVAVTLLVVFAIVVVNLVSTYLYLYNLSASLYGPFVALSNKIYTHTYSQTFKYIQLHASLVGTIA